MRCQIRAVVSGRCRGAVNGGALAMPVMPHVLEGRASRQVSTGARRREVIGLVRGVIGSGGRALIAA